MNQYVYIAQALTKACSFSIDGVIQRSNDPLPRAKAALSYLQKNRIPFILLTNGGGKHESERISTLSDRLGLPLDVDLLVQSHTPYADFHHYKEKTILVVGGEANSCQQIAKAYVASFIELSKLQKC